MLTSTTKDITIQVNGERAVVEARTLADLVASRGFAEGEVATALNGEFVARQARASALLGVGDRVEIVAPRQGG